MKIKRLWYRVCVLAFIYKDKNELYDLLFNDLICWLHAWLRGKTGKNREFANFKFSVCWFLLTWVVELMFSEDEFADSRFYQEGGWVSVSCCKLVDVDFEPCSFYILIGFRYFFMWWFEMFGCSCIRFFLKHLMARLLIFQRYVIVVVTKLKLVD